ncbi:acyltransferase [Mammaliicoccus sciuri]|uniref:acyltransferase n=1 Tax=Mammaliicoccus sciuri TaxID=1296 RepID=UPI003F542EBE
MNNKINQLLKKGLLILGTNVEIQENVVLGIKEENNIEEQSPIKIGDNTILRAGSIIYEGVTIGENVRIGHNTILRSWAKIGDNTCLSHNIVIEHHTIIGDWVRMSPQSHITSNMIIEDRAFVGAGVVTVNDKYLVWKREDKLPELIPPKIKFGAKVGSGSTLCAGVIIGEMSIIGSGSIVTRNIPSKTIAYGTPAKVVKENPEVYSKPNGPTI